MTRTLFLMKTAGGIHLKNFVEDFHLSMTELEHEWTLITTTDLPHLDPNLSHKLLSHNIYKIKHITLPNGTNLMSKEEFQTYHHKPSKILKSALKIA